MPIQARVIFANQLRGLAVVLVMVSHLVVLFWAAPSFVTLSVAAPAPTVPPPWVSVLLAGLPQISLGPLGVAIFFLISGFVIPFSLAKLSVGEFARARLLRILPPYWVGLALQVAVIAASASFWDLPDQLSWQRILANAALAFNLFHVSSIDTVNWTLVVELAFYGLAGLAAPWLRAGRCWPLALFWLSCVLVNTGMAWASALVPSLASKLATASVYVSSLAFMTLGCVFHLAMRGVLGRSAFAGLLGAGLLSFVLSKVLGPAGEGEAAILASYTLALLLFGLAYQFRDRFRPTPLLDALAAISYPLYLIHAVVGYTALRFAMVLWGWSYGAALLMALGLILPVAWLLHVTVERWSIAAGRPANTADQRPLAPPPVAP